MNRQATRSAILEALDELASEALPGDQAFIYYSGHGTSSDDLRTRGFGESRFGWSRPPSRKVMFRNA